MKKPSGNITFLFTDIEGSTKLAQEYPDTLQAAIERHHLILNDAIESNNGFIFEIVGDGFCCTFENAMDAVRAAVEIQINLSNENWKDAAIKVRAGIHSGYAEWNGKKYIGYMTLARSARIMSCGHGEQIIISDSAYESCGAWIHEANKLNITFGDLGERRLKDLNQPLRLYQINAEGLRSDFPPLKTLDARPNNLPFLLSNFIGREESISHVKKFLKESRIVTITGSGGSGKTRLALQTGADLTDEFAHGVFIAELAPVSDPSFIMQTIINSLGIKENAGKSPEETVIAYLKNKELLLILDNCEHMINDCSGISEMLLYKCENLKIIATSREALNSSGEHLYRIPALELPDNSINYTPDELMQNESVRLFSERALSVNSEFKINTSNIPAIIKLCNRLDGIPLAIELAAAYTKVLSAEKINERLDDRFNLLTGGKRTALPRHQTLKAMIDWSYDLLSEKEKILWNRLSVFNGGWTLEASENVCSGDIIQKNEILDLILKLTEKSIVNYDAVRERYVFLESIKQYGKEKLDESNETQDILSKHLNYYLELSESSEPELIRKDIHIWMEKLESDHGNFQSAIEWSVTGGDREKSVRLAGALWSFWKIRGHYSTGIRHLENILKNTDGVSESALGKAYYCRGILTMLNGDYEKSKLYYKESLMLRRKSQDKSGIADTLNSLGSAEYYSGNYEQALNYYEESYALRKESGNKHGIAMSLNNLGNIAYYKSDIEKARECFKESLLLNTGLGEKRGISHSLNNLGVISLEQSNYAESQKYFEESLELARSIGERSGIAYSLYNMGYVLFLKKEYENALEYMEMSINLNNELGDKWGVSVSLIIYSAIQLQLERLSLASILIGTADSCLTSIGRALEQNLKDIKNQVIIYLKEKLSEDEFKKYYEDGKKLSIDEAIQIIDKS